MPYSLLAPYHAQISKESQINVACLFFTINPSHPKYPPVKHSCLNTAQKGHRRPLKPLLYRLRSTKALVDELRLRYVRLHQHGLQARASGSLQSLSCRDAGRPLADVVRTKCLFGLGSARFWLFGLFTVQKMEEEGWERDALGAQSSGAAQTSLKFTLAPKFLW